MKRKKLRKTRLGVSQRMDLDAHRTDSKRKEYECNKIMFSYHSIRSL
jgi:hypothetical protein